MFEEVYEVSILVWCERGNFREKEIRDWKFVGDFCVPIANERGFWAEWVCLLFGIFLFVANIGCYTNLYS